MRIGGQWGMWAAVTCVLWISGCGAAVQSRPRVTPFTVQDAVLFDDGVDFVADPVALERWGEDFGSEIDQRVERSDLIAIVEVNTLRTDVDPDQRTTLRVVAEFQRDLLGNSEGDEITLLTNQNTRGHNTVNDNQRRILATEHVLYLKWYESDQGAIAAHWHLSPASEAVVDRTTTLIRERRRAASVADPERRERVIVHEN